MTGDKMAALRLNCMATEIRHIKYGLLAFHAP